MTQGEFEAIVNDTSKEIHGNIVWSEDEDHSRAVEFRVDVASEADYPLCVHGRYNAEAQKLGYSLIHKAVGRIYAVDLGTAHHNPSCEMVGETHKHRWAETTGTKEAYVPDDITAGTAEPLTVWKQFCAEAKIKHDGALAMPVES